MTPKNVMSIIFFLGIEIATAKIIYSKCLRKICCQLLLMMNVLKISSSMMSISFKNREMTNTYKSKDVPLLLLQLNDPGKGSNISITNSLQTYHKKLSEDVKIL